METERPDDQKVQDNIINVPFRQIESICVIHSFGGTLDVLAKACDTTESVISAIVKMQKRKKLRAKYNISGPA